MHFNIVLSNHYAPGGVWRLEDVTRWLKASLEEAGHLVSIAPTIIEPRAVNLFFEYFPLRAVPVFEKLAKLGVCFGIVCTENITGDTFNGFDKDDDWINEGEGFNWKRRYANFRKVARSAEFVWCLYEDSSGQARDLVPNGKAFPLKFGYVESLLDIRHRPFSEKDIDLLFFGQITSHRKSILEALTARGLTVEWAREFIPNFVRNAFMERSKIVLSLLKHEAWESPSLGRIAYLVNNGCCTYCETSGAVSEIERYALSSGTETFVDDCEAAVRGKPIETLANTFATRFAADLPMKGIMLELLDQTFQRPTVRLATRGAA